MLIKSALRDWLYESYSMKSILVISSLRSPPFGGCATTFPPQAGALQPVLNLESLMKKLPHGALFCHRLRGKSREAGKGDAFLSPVRAVVKVLYKLAPSINLEALHHNPRAKGASNLSPLSTFGPAGRQPSSPIGACPISRAAFLLTTSLTCIRHAGIM